MTCQQNYYFLRLLILYNAYLSPSLLIKHFVEYSLKSSSTLPRSKVNPKNNSSTTTTHFILWIAPKSNTRRPQIYAALPLASKVTLNQTNKTRKATIHYLAKFLEKYSIWIKFLARIPRPMGSTDTELHTFHCNFYKLVSSFYSVPWHTNRISKQGDHENCRHHQQYITTFKLTQALYWLTDGYRQFPNPISTNGDKIQEIPRVKHKNQGTVKFGAFNLTMPINNQLSRQQKPCIKDEQSNSSHFSSRTI